MQRSNILQFKKTRFEQLEQAILVGDRELVRSLGSAIQQEFRPVHDGLVETVTALLGFFVMKTSPEEGERIGCNAMERHMQGKWFDQYLGNHGNSSNQLKQQIRDIVETWHWHPSQITLTEDEEKVTIHTHPCGSGMRLEQSGKYDTHPSYARSVTPSPSNFMEKDFPIYCNHCPEMNLTSLKKGATTWLVEGWKPTRNRSKGTCVQHSYKQLKDVPKEFYRRVGLDTPDTFPDQSGAKTRLFTDEELRTLATHPVDRLINDFDKRGKEAALSALVRCKAGWTGMHHAYPLNLGILLTECLRHFGHDGMTESLESALPMLFANISDGSPQDWASFWSLHMGLSDIAFDAKGFYFVIRPEALINSDTWPASVEELCLAINRGLHAQDKLNIGVFNYRDSAIVHHLPSR